MPDVLKELKPFFKGAFINNEGFKPETALERVKSGFCQAVTFGQLALANPTLPEKIKNNIALNTDIKWDNLFAGGETGYTTYE